MSDVPTDPAAGQPGQSGQPSEEEVRAYLGQLRAAPVDQILAEVLSSLLNAAQVKIGRRDGRLLLDATAVLVDQVRSTLPQELTSQLDDVFAQLRTAQVQAEPEVAAAVAQGQAEENDLPADATSAPAGAGTQDDAASTDAGTSAPGGSTPSGGSSSGGDAASRLWVPGR